MKRILCIISVLLVCAALTGCTDIEDTNGADDFTLRTITDENIIKGMSSTAISSVKTTNGGLTSVKVGKLSGVQQLQRFGKGDYVIKVSLEVTSGNLRLVLCSKTEIVHEFKVNEADQMFTVNGDIGELYLKVAGESAAYSLTYTKE